MDGAVKLSRVVAANFYRTKHKRSKIKERLRIHVGELIGEEEAFYQADGVVKLSRAIATHSCTAKKKGVK